MGVDRGILNAMQEHKDKVSGPHFIFSAENAGHPAKNQLGMSHYKTLYHLKNSGYDAHSVSGQYGKPERSIIVYGVDPDRAEELHNLASRLGQDSSIYSSGKRHEMRFHHGDQAGKKVFGEGTTWHKEKPGDYFTTLPGGQHHFTHNFDFGSPADPLPDSKMGKAEPKVKINPEHGRQIADAYEAMPHTPNDPKVKDAYGALINETGQQFKNIMGSGMKISRIQPGQANPYKTSKDMHHDIKTNKHLWYFPTEAGFGSGDKKTNDHPMLAPTEFKHGGQNLLANDIFRIVHDINGHHVGGESGFGPSGEHNAYLTHKKAYSPLAQQALATETMGQNNWVNFSREHGENNRKNPSKTVYAEQKAGLLPSHIINGKWHHES